ncbi:hypothetical protein C8Q79DRAFT_737316 [Trametes meyenii]|nr:hypothetical protein C8Q79DRAFT_737316 [Trametes meyenii]
MRSRGHRAHRTRRPKNVCGRPLCLPSSPAPAPAQRMHMRARANGRLRECIAVGGCRSSSSLESLIAASCVLAFAFSRSRCKFALGDGGRGAPSQTSGVGLWAMAAGYCAPGTSTSRRGGGGRVRGSGRSKCVHAARGGAGEGNMAGCVRPYGTPSEIGASVTGTSTSTSQARGRLVAQPMAGDRVDILRRAASGEAPLLPAEVEACCLARALAGHVVLHPWM